MVAQCEASWVIQQIGSHSAARDSIDAIIAAVFPEAGRRARNGGATEFEIQQRLIEAFRGEGLVADSPPIVTVNQRLGNSRHSTFSEHSAQIQPGDIVLLDVWGTKNAANAVYYDIRLDRICWDSLPLRIAEVFQIVRRSRDAGIERSFHCGREKALRLGG